MIGNIGRALSGALETPILDADTVVAEALKEDRGFFGRIVVMA